MSPWGHLFRPRMETQDCLLFFMKGNKKRTHGRLTFGATFRFESRRLSAEEERSHGRRRREEERILGSAAERRRGQSRGGSQRRWRRPSPGQNESDERRHGHRGQHHRLGHLHLAHGRPAEHGQHQPGHHRLGHIRFDLAPCTDRQPLLPLHLNYVSVGHSGVAVWCFLRPRWNRSKYPSIQALAESE